MNRLQYQIQTGEFIASTGTISNTSTDWTNLNSSDFVDSTTGALLDADLAFVDISIYNPGTNTAYFKLRALDAINDATANEIFILAGGAIDIQCGGLKGGAITTVSYKKGASGDDLKLICAFNRKLV